MVAIETAQEGRVTIARLERSDTPLLTRFFHRLSPESVYRRFFSPITRPGHFANSFRLDAERWGGVAIAAVESGEVVGVAQFARPNASKAAEMAVVVADAWQRQGLGTRLLAVLADRAQTEGVEALTVSVQGDNLAAIRLLRRWAPGIRLSIAGGVGEGLIPLPDRAR